MKNYKCSMQKKIESLGKKSEKSRSALIREYASLYGVGAYMVSELLDMGYSEEELDDVLNDFVNSHPTATRKPTLDSMVRGLMGFGESHKRRKSEKRTVTFKVGDFVSYEAGKDGKDPYDAYVYCEVIGINDDGTLDLCPFGTDADTDGIGDNASPAYCEKLDHFAGMVDAHHYYMDGKYNAYKGGWEILITDKELNPKVYEFIGTIDDLSEVIDIDDYYGGENFVFDKDLKDEVANNTGWDVETTTFADMTGDVG